LLAHPAMVWIRGRFDRLHRAAHHWTIFWRGQSAQQRPNTYARAGSPKELGSRERGRATA
jgi:hypothetical protein